MSASQRSLVPALLALIASFALLVAGSYGAAQLLWQRAAAEGTGGGISAPGVTDLLAGPLLLPLGILVTIAVLFALALTWVLHLRLSTATAPSAAKAPATNQSSSSTADPQLPPPTEAGAMSLLHLLQREGRLVDFLREEISPFTDEQIGAAVRAIHADCRQALADKIVIEPVMARAEGERVVVESGFDPGAIRLTGNVVGNGPYHGTLRHHGWRVVQNDLPERPASQDPRILAPAEVEVE